MQVLFAAITLLLLGLVNSSDMKRFTLTAFIIFYVVFLFAQTPTVQFFPNYHSIGYRIALPPNFDTDSNANVLITYQSANHPLDTGFAPYRLQQDTFREFRGSLFMLEPNTTYRLQITITDSTPFFQTFTFVDSVITRSEPVIQATSNIKYVSPNGSGNAYTLSNPGNLATLINSNTVTCGTTIMLLDGIYDAANMILNLNTNCTSQTPIIIMAAPGANPILDGGYYQQLSWTQHTFDSLLYESALPSVCNFTALCLLDSLRLYPYAGINTTNTIPNHYPMQNLGYGISGFCRDNSIIRIKTTDGKKPAQHQVILSQSNSCLRVNGNNKNCYLHIKGIRFKHYNKPFVEPTYSYPSFTLDFNDCNFVTIDSCSFEYTNNPITFTGSCNYNTVQHCYIKDQTGRWGHEAFKETAYPLNSPLSVYQAIYFNTNYKTAIGRNLENFGINFSPYDTKATGNVIRNCTIDGVVAGIAIGRVGNPMIMAETDVYNNKIVNCYDGLDNMNGQINLRVWNNEISHSPVGISCINGRYGPRYVFRNLIHHIEERANPSLDPNRILFSDCSNQISPKLWGSGIKMNAGATTANPGSLFLMHNTFHSKDTLGFAMYLWRADWRKLFSRNNIFYSEGLSTFFFDDVGGDAQYSFDSQHDDFFNAATGVIATVQPVNGQPLCYTYITPAALDTALQNITQAADVQIKNAQNAHPLFKVNGSDFRLQCTSPLIDKGMILPGINNRNFDGEKPDIGAFEFKKTLLQSSTSKTLQQKDTTYHFTTNGSLTSEYVYDTIYTTVNEVVYDTTTHVDCVWLPTSVHLADTSYFVSVADTTDACDTITIHTTNTQHQYTYVSVYDTTVCDTLVVYKTTVKLNTVGLKGVTNKRFSFYPNPAFETVHITTTNEAIHNIHLLNMHGEIIPVWFNHNHFHVNHVSSGIYMLMINNSVAGKLVVLKQ